MVLITPVNIAPFPPGSASLTKAAREWERGTGAMLAESDRASSSVALARRGGLAIRNEASGVRANSNRVSQGVGQARPNAEAGLAWSATANGPGTEHKISRATENAGNPGAHVPAFDPNRPFRLLTPATTALQRERERLALERSKADDVERGYRRR